jgi:hypothetical protein
MEPQTWKVTVAFRAALGKRYNSTGRVAAPPKATRFVAFVAFMAFEQAAAAVRYWPIASPHGGWDPTGLRKPDILGVVG